MKVICIENKGNSLPKEIMEDYGIKTGNIPITIGTVYTVYALTVYLGIVWYYIADDSYTDYPVWVPSLLFEIVDNQLSRFWRYSNLQGNISIKLPSLTKSH